MKLKRSACIAVKCSNKILLVKRTRSMKRYPGLFGFPGGKVENNESTLDCARRELFEETGIHADANSFKTIAKLRDKEYSIHYYLLDVTNHFQVPDSVKVKLSPSEHSEYKWMDLKDLMNINGILSYRNIAPITMDVIRTLAITL